ncbi:SGNH/GDSL hydrolase family protein [Sporanaerobium hydrogeniformans]|uniref:SGNH/GDSL hydrolase family protein n=1 Tax=Sporanaerobium hydrogeniformans TaxID=3072179 RepID=UPI0015D4B4E2|nr:SGNH/GDSL hydrolase family protein [Sporanaerobium hydrogeniformans]
MGLKQYFGDILLHKILKVNLPTGRVAGDHLYFTKDSNSKYSMYVTDQDGSLKECTYNSELDDKINILNNKNLLAKALLKINTGQMCKICCYGDSVTHGYNATTPYTTVLQEKYRKITHNDNITVVNCGHDNWTSNNGLIGIDEVMEHSPEVCILMFGINDANTNISLDTYYSNVSKMCDILNGLGVAVILMTSNPIFKLNLSFKLKAYVDCIREIALKKSLCLIDINEIFNDLFMRKIAIPLALIPDEIHPNNLGLSYIADNAIATMQSLLKVREASYFAFYNNSDVKTDITNNYSDTGMTCLKNYYYMPSYGTYFVFPFFIDKLTSILSLETLKFTNCASYNVRIDGEIVKEVNGYSANLTKNVQEQIATVGYGLHFLEVLQNDKTTTSTGTNFHLCALMTN